jgi:hypothetical protein
MIPATDVLAEVFTEEIGRQKKEQGDKPCSRNCVDPVSAIV